MENIYSGNYFSKTAAGDYVNAFYKGYELGDYSNGEECKKSFLESMDFLHEFNLNMTRRYSFRDPFLLTFKGFGQEINDFWFNCFNLGWNLKEVYEEKAANFVDTGDIYLSFLFNLLGNAIRIKKASENMVNATALHDTEKLVENIAVICRVVLDFNSYKSVGAAYNPSDSTFIARRLQSDSSFMKKTENKELANRKSEARLAAYKHLKYGNVLSAVQKSELAFFSINPRSEFPGVENIHDRANEGYSWKAVDFIQAPFALLIGSLHALPDESFGYRCSKNTTTSRGKLLDAVEQFEIDETIKGVQDLHESFKLFDEMGLYCFYAFSVDLSAEHWTKIFSVWYEIPINLMYGAGFMWVDVINWLFYNPSSVPNGDWGFFTVYLIGDFLMRFFYRDESPAK